MPARDLIRGMLDAFLQGRGVLTADRGWTDQFLASLGFEPVEDEWLGDLQLLREQLANRGFTYLLRGRDFKFSKTNAGVAFLDQFSGRLELVDLDSGEIAWQEDVSSLEYGGVLLQSSQVIRGFRQSFDRNTNGQELRLGIAICQDVLDDWPGFESNSQLVQTSLPDVTDVRLTEVEVPEGTVPRRTLDVIGTTDCKARLRLPDGRLHPFQEVQTSLYRAHFELTPPEVLQQSTIILTGRFGLQARLDEADWFDVVPETPDDDTTEGAGR